MKRTIQKITAAAMALSLSSCSFSEIEKGFSLPDIPTKGEADIISLDEFNDRAKKLLKDIKKPGKEADVQASIDDLIKQLDIACEAKIFAELKKNFDFNNEELDEIFEEYEEQCSVMEEAMRFVFSKGCRSEYSDLFSGLVTEDEVEYYTSPGLTLSRIEGYASVDYRVSDEYLDAYYEVSYDDKLTNKEKDLKCAEIYLDIISEYSPETFYDGYCRDYSPEDMLKMAEDVRKYIIPIDGEIEDKFWADQHSMDVFDKPVTYQKPFDVVQEYAEKISPEIGLSAKKLNDEKLYTIAKGDGSYTGSYTDTLRDRDSAVVYIYSDGSYYDLSSCIHEFGHFHSMLSDHVSQFESVVNLDLAEVQSTGMELLFMEYYDDIYGEQADAMRLMQLSDITSAIVTGFLVGEFEYKALTRAEELTPQEVLDLYEETMGDYAVGFPFFYVSHMYEAPGYYVSYGVSALAALDGLREPDKMVEKYQKISEQAISSKDVSFIQALIDCGYSNVLDSGYVKEISEVLKTAVNDSVKTNIRIQI